MEPTTDGELLRHDDTVTMARWFSLMVLSGALITGASLIANLTPDRHRWIELAMAGCCVPAAVLLWRLRLRSRAWMYRLFVGPFVATQLAVGIWLSGDVTNPAEAFYIPTMVFCFYFFPWRVALANLAVMGATFFAALLTVGSLGPALDRWMFTFVMAVLAGCVVAHLRDRLIAQSSLDWLTGVANRRGFDSIVEDQRQRALRRAKPLTLMLVDLDEFKTLNDTRGHASGDRALRAVARALAGAVGAARVARLGGDEFAVVLADVDQHAAVVLAERLRESIAADAELPTVSIGVASLDPDEPVIRSLVLTEADDALYAAKQGGRNRVAASSSLLAPAEPGWAR